MTVLSVFLLPWLLCDGSHSIITRQSPLTFQKYLLRSFRLSAPGPLRQPWSCPENLLKTLFPLFSLCSDSEWGNWLEWLGRVGDWQRLTSYYSDNERGGELQRYDLWSVLVYVCVWLCVIEQGLSTCVPMCMFLHAFTHACILHTLHCVCLQIHNYKSVWNYVSIHVCVSACASLPRDPSTLQLAWPQGYAALSFSGALHLWQLSLTCAALPGTLQLVERWNWLSPRPWDDSGIVSLSQGKCHLSAKSVTVLKAEMCMSG